MNASPGRRRRQGGLRLRRPPSSGPSAGENVILVRRETNPDDLHGMVAAAGILTSRGGKTSHAAVVARGMGRTCVCGADELDVDVEAGQFSAPGRRRGRRGRRDLDRRHHRRGLPRRGAGRWTPWWCATSRATRPTDDELVAAVARLMEHADSARRLGVRANADTPDDAARARRFGAQGIGLCRTEHMFLGERRELVEHLILADDDDEREAALVGAAAAAARRLRGDPRGDGRAAGDDPADRPAAARVPARPHRAVDEGRGRRRARGRPAASAT